MKILVINLLRLGDVIMTVPMINGLANSRKDAQVDVLTFKSSAGLQNMIPTVRRWWTIDRDQLQAGLGRADLPMLSSYSLLKEKLDSINAEEYDLIVNLTQTHFSAWVAGYLKSPDRLGLTYDTKGIAHFYSPWFRYLDDRAEGFVEDVFHHTDIFAHACGIGEQRRDWTMRALFTAQTEIEKLNLKETETVILQMFTSTDEKNWTEVNWLQMVKELKAQRPQAQFVALGSPAEEKRIREIAAKSEVEIVPAIVSLEGALALMNRSHLLITGDTSIKHLANASSIKVLELSIGWSDWRRTGAYKADSLILRAAENQSLKPSDVKTAAANFLDEKWDAITRTASAGTVHAYRTFVLSAGFWFAHDLSSSNEAAVVSTLVERCAWKLSMNRGRNTDPIRFGSEGMSLCRELRGIVPEEKHKPMLAHLEFLERAHDEQASIVNSELIVLKRERPAGKSLLEISGFRKKQIELEIASKHLEFKTKMIRTIKSTWTESQ
jgi:ADP-heptose:LPS heptosyltransferase